jgi:hypothetical protein
VTVVESTVDEVTVVEVALEEVTMVEGVVIDVSGVAVGSHATRNTRQASVRDRMSQIVRVVTRFERVFKICPARTSIGDWT